ncbi:restriction endonuclease subunit S [Salegentibacter sp. UBA1130]|uniref:restriction endonuclease subunit S n=1 Tax=Salegentibacter sp. UBA1130 TaxID=1947451 RepID=UPI00257FCBC4|nr:restriction endonuclease subunit S [Salegentibacter sp. UBA1130]
MELKKGYKQTEVGVIPEDWEYSYLGNLGVFKKGKGIRKDEVISDGLQCVRYGQLYTTYDFLIYETKSFISSYSAENSTKIKKGDILFAGSGETKDEIGKCATLTSDKITYAGGDIIILTPSNANSVYLGYLLNEKSIQKQKSQMGQGDAVVHIYSSGLSKIKIPLPPIEEQKAIAQVLSDTDQLIQNLKTLLAKKHAIKQGAMQELLTGKKRLKGFDGEWEMSKLGDIANFHKGKALSKSQIKESGKTKCIHYGELFTKYSEVITEINNRTDLTEKIFLSRANDILMPTSDVTPRGLATASCINEDGVILGGDILVIRVPNSLLNGIFFSYLISINKDKVLQLVTGSTVYHLYGSDMAKFEFKLPNDIKEQKAIAQILSDMDSEIEALEIQLGKTQHLKQGMMQELLTGRIRLVKPVSPSKKKERLIKLKPKIESTTIPIAAEPKKEYKSEKTRNEHITDAVLIGTMADSFGSKEFPLTRFMYTKVSYLFKRFKQVRDNGYLKKAAGPYKPKTRYGGAEKIALDNNYVQLYISYYNGKKYENFIAGDNCKEAISYFKKWYGENALKWIQQFKYTKRDHLELWTTVDMAIQDLSKANKLTNFQTVKKLINEDREWRPKLKRPVFSDENIKMAIKKVNQLFGKN